MTRGNQRAMDVMFKFLAQWGTDAERSNVLGSFDVYNWDAINGDSLTGQGGLFEVYFEDKEIPYCVFKWTEHGANDWTVMLLPVTIIESGRAS